MSTAVLKGADLIGNVIFTWDNMKNYVVWGEQHYKAYRGNRQSTIDISEIVSLVQVSEDWYPVQVNRKYRFLTRKSLSCAVHIKHFVPGKTALFQKLKNAIL